MARGRRKVADKHQYLPEDTIKRVAMEDVFPFENNPRTNDSAIEIIANSIREFGFNVPILLDRYGVIIAGHTRYAAAKQLGMTHVPAIYSESLTEEQANAFRIVDNKTAEKSSWDDDLLSVQIDELKDVLDFTDYGFDQEELDSLLGIEEEPDTPTDNSTESEARTRAQSRVKISVGEFIFHIDQPEYRRWANQIRNECDFSEDEINLHIKELLGLTPYEEAETT